MKFSSLKIASSVILTGLLFGCGGGGSSDLSDPNGDGINKTVYDGSEYLFNSKSLNHGEPLSVDQVDNTVYKRFDALGNSLNTDENPIQEHNQEALSTLVIFDKIYKWGVNFATLGPGDKLFTIITVHDTTITRENNLTGDLMYEIPRTYKSGDTFTSNMINNDGETIVAACKVSHKDNITIANPQTPTTDLVYNDLLIFDCDESSAGGVLQQTTVKYYIKDQGEVLNTTKKNGSAEMLYEVTFR